MKLSKARLTDMVRGQFEKLGFRLFTNTVLPPKGLFVKRVEHDIFLSVGLTISRFYDSQFTADYYLSKSTRFGSTWGDIPKDSFTRIGFLLKDDERENILDEKYRIIKDAWWDAANLNNVKSFFKVLEITQTRMGENFDLINRIRKSQDLNIMASHVNKLYAVLNSNFDSQYVFSHQPIKEIKYVPSPWFQAAEIALNETGGILNRKTVELVAIDAWLQRELVGASNP